MPAPPTTSAPTTAPPTTAPPTTTSPPPPPSGLVDTGTGWSASGLTGPMPGPGSCHYRTATDGNPLPDPTCTPGAINTMVTQDNIQSTICASGYSSSIRPPESITEPAKYQSMTAYSAPGSASQYEYDHLVPLELGGSSDTRNLWPELDSGSPSQFDSSDSYGENAKDGVEDRLNAAVCSGQVMLAAAQEAIAINWTTAEASPRHQPLTAPAKRCRQKGRPVNRSGPPGSEACCSSGNQHISRDITSRPPGWSTVTSLAARRHPLRS